MTWIWQHAEWPQFKYDSEKLKNFEIKFQHISGIFIGALKYIGQENLNEIIVQVNSLEAIKTSEIENEILDRASVQSSIQKQFGLRVENVKANAAENGIAQLMCSLYQDYSKKLSHTMLFDWHKTLMQGRSHIKIGAYRTSKEPMQIVSGAIYAPKVHYEAIPVDMLKSEMTQFIDWFNQSATGSNALTPLIRAGIAHLYFECIHPFEDGNGRIGRAIAEKVLSQAFSRPSLLLLSATIEKHRKEYYCYLEKSSKSIEITEWLVWFAKIILESQMDSQNYVEFIVKKTKLFDTLKDKLNERQEKVLVRLTKEGLEGFKGGLSTGNYMQIAKTSSATAHRDLVELVELGALKRTGEKKYARYWLPFGKLDKD